MRRGEGRNINSDDCDLRNNRGLELWPIGGVTSAYSYYYNLYVSV